MRSSCNQLPFPPKRILVLLAAFFLGPALWAQANSDFLGLRNGHTGTVRFFAAAEGVAASYGTDKQLLVWDLEARQLERRISLSEGSVFKLAIHPRGTRAALITSPSSTNFRLQEYNLETGSRLFSTQIPNLPLTLAYSDDGQVILTSNPEQNSLKFYSSGNGRSMRGFSRGFGIVDTASMSSNGGSLFSYQANRGLISYHRMSNFQELANIQTISNLQSIQMFSNKRYAVARSGATVFIIDVVTGSQKSSLAVDSLSSIVLLSDSLLALVRNVGLRPSVQWVQIDGSSFANRSAETRIDITAQLIAAENESSLVFVNQSGSLSTISPGNSVAQAFETPRLGPIRAALVSQDKFFITSNLGLYYFSHEEVLPKLAPPHSSELSSSVLREISLPFAGAPGLLQLSDGRVLVWNLTSPGPIYLLSDQLDLRELTQQRQQTIVRIREQGENLILFYANERLELVRSADFSTILQYSNVSLSDAIVLDSEYLIVTGSRSSGFSTSLLKLNLRTHETTPIPDNGIVFYRLEHASSSGSFTALGVTTGDSEYSTGTKVFQFTRRGNNFSSQVLASYSEQDSDASMVRSERGTIVSVIDRDLQLIIDSRRSSSFGRSNKQAQSLTLLQNFVAAVNVDGSLSFWDQATRRFTGNLVQFTDKTALILGPNKNLIFLLPPESNFVPDREFLSQLLLADARTIAQLHLPSSEQLDEQLSEHPLTPSELPELQPSQSGLRSVP